ncbi:MAG: hypothetical protein ACRBG0_21660 [Lewinella sp.]|uniref:hypothetical protein n=1 Tax=Lewinella sp. TaxID=2004506 RepID=UPI003D6B9FAF
MEALIFEDETLTRIDIELVCQGFGINTPDHLSFVSSQDALAFIEQKQELDNLYVAVLDIKDDALTGRDAQTAGIRIARAIRSKNPSIPIVFYTGLGRVEGENRLIEGPYGIVYKEDLQKLRQSILEQIPTLPPRVPALEAGLFSYERDGTTFFFHIRDILFVERVAKQFGVYFIPKPGQPVVDVGKEQSWKKIQDTRQWAHGGSIILLQDGEELCELYQMNLDGDTTKQDISNFITELGKLCSRDQFTRKDIEQLIEHQLFISADYSNEAKDYCPLENEDGSYSDPVIADMLGTINQTAIIIDTIKQEVLFWRVRVTPWYYLQLYLKDGKLIKELPVANLTISDLTDKIEAMRTFYSASGLSCHQYCIVNLAHLKKVYANTGQGTQIILGISDGEERVFTGQYGNIIDVIRTGKTIPL